MLLLAFVFTRGKPQHKQDAQKTAEQYIGVVVPYQPAKAEAAAARRSRPTDARASSTGLGAADHAGFSRVSRRRRDGAKPIRPAMLSYVVHTDRPKPSTASPPAEPPQTGLTFKASTCRA